MANMSYCRFQNTVSDLRDCYEADGMYDPDVLSAEEKRAREELIQICRNIVSDLGNEDDD